MGRDGFEPSKSVTADLQSAPFGHSGTYPRYSLCSKRNIAIISWICILCQAKNERNFKKGRLADYLMKKDDAAETVSSLDLPKQQSQPQWMSPLLLRLAQLGEILDGANHLAGVAVLVVVPRNNQYYIQIIRDL